jgi:hypothetical protein
MKTGYKFTEVMKERSYDELLEIVGKLRNEYQPEAVVAAELELKNRKPPVEINEPEEKKLKTNKQPVFVKANEPLEDYQKIYYLIVPHPFNFIKAKRLENEGYFCKAKEVRKLYFNWHGYHICTFYPVYLFIVFY